MRKRASPPFRRRSGSREGESAPRRGRYTFTCPRGGIYTYGGKEYCADCGFHLKTPRRHCGTEFLYGFPYAFCPECGGVLGPGEELEDERAEREAADLALKKKETPEEDQL